MILAHYILWRLGGYDGPVMLIYILIMAGVAWGIIEGVDAIAKRSKKKSKRNGP